MSKRLIDGELQTIRERLDNAWEHGEGVGELAFKDIPKLLAEIVRLRNAISWGVSCSECSNQLAEEWEIVRGSFVCRECIEYGGDSE